MLQTSIISQDANAITVRMSRSRWKRLQQLEELYKVATSIRKAMKQVEKAPIMNVDEALSCLREL